MASEVYKPTDEELALLKRWYAPDVADDVDTRRTNAFKMNVSELNKPREPIKTEDAEPESNTLSANALAEITQQAHEQGYQDGLQKGKEEGLLQGHQTGYEQGLEQGAEEGKAQGLAQAQPEIEQRLALLDVLSEKLSEPLSLQQGAIEKSLVQLALTLAQKVIHTEISQNSQPLINAVRAGVKAIGHAGHINIAVNPQDLEALESVWDKEQRLKKDITFDVDASIAAGDCYLETPTSSISINLEERVAQVFDDFLSQSQPTHEHIKDAPGSNPSEHVGVDLNDEQSDD